ncbi:MAG TPA: glycosyltransferase [Burkholderiaceae bacterium]
MKISHVNFARRFGAGERQTLNLIAGLKRYGFDQILVCRPGSELQRRATAGGIDTLGISHPLLGHSRSLSSDIIHVHEARAAYWAAIEHAVRKTDYIITRRTPNPISNSSLTKGIYREAADLVGVSQYVSNRLAGQISRSVGTILSAATDHAPKLEDVQRIRNGLGGGPVIGHVGALHDRHKGQSVLVEAFHKLAARVPEARLVLVGEGPDKARLFNLAKGDERIVFAGFQEQVGAWIAAMDIFAFPSREEGHGSAVLDAMALGVPVIASSAGGLPEMLGDSERGVLLQNHNPAEWAAAMAAVLAHGNVRGHKVRAAYRFALQHDISRMCDRYVGIYEGVMRRRQSNSRHMSQLSDEEFWKQIDASELRKNWGFSGNRTALPQRRQTPSPTEDDGDCRSSSNSN